MNMKKMTIRLEEEQIQFIQSLRTNSLTSSHIIRGMIDFLIEIKEKNKLTYRKTF